VTQKSDRHDLRPPRVPKLRAAVTVSLALLPIDHLLPEHDPMQVVRLALDAAFGPPAADEPWERANPSGVVVFSTIAASGVNHPTDPSLVGIRLPSGPSLWLRLPKTTRERDAWATFPTESRFSR